MNPNFGAVSRLLGWSGLPNPQVQLPLFPSGTTVINEALAYERREDQVVYFNGHLPVFTHRADDLASFRLFTTQLIVNGTASQGDIVRAFGVSMTTVKLGCRRYRERGAVPIRFEAATDVPQGGVLCALPALLVLGLLRYSAASFAWLPGYYPLETIFLAIRPAGPGAGARVGNTAV